MSSRDHSCPSISNLVPRFTLSLIRPFVLSVLILLASTSLMHIVVFLLHRALFLSSPALALMLRMVLPSVSIVIFLRPLMLSWFPLSFHHTSGLRLSLRLSFSLTDSPPLFDRVALPTSVSLVTLLATVTSDALGVPALFFFLLVSARS